MPTLRGGMRRAGWRSSPLTWVCACRPTACRGLLTEMAPDMLTPVDQPLDKLDDLTPEELCVPPTSHLVPAI